MITTVIIFILYQLLYIIIAPHLCECADLTKYNLSSINSWKKIGYDILTNFKMNGLLITLLIIFSLGGRKICY